MAAAPTKACDKPDIVPKMTSSEHNETSVTVVSASPGLIGTLQHAALIAADCGHTYVGTEHVLAALFSGHLTPLEVLWPRIGAEPLKRGEVNDFDPSTPQQALTYAEVRELVHAVIPEPGGGRGLPTRTVEVTYELSGPNADEYRAAIEHD